MAAQKNLATRAEARKMPTNKNLFALLGSDDEEEPKKVQPKKVDQKPQAKDTSSKSRSAKRGGRGNAGRGGKRAFDRKSGSGRGKETSKHGGGARNWGNEKDRTELDAEAAIESGKMDEQDEASADNEEEEEEEEEDNEMTLDEYLEMKKSERSGENFAEIEVREVSTEFENASIVTKEGKTPDFIESNYEKVHRERSSGRKKQVFEGVGFRAPPTNDRFRDNRDNGARGGRRGRGGRGRGSYAPNVADMKAFPSLN